MSLWEFTPIQSLNREPNEGSDCSAVKMNERRITGKMIWRWVTYKSLLRPECLLLAILIQQLLTWLILSWPLLFSVCYRYSGWCSDVVELVEWRKMRRHSCSHFKIFFQRLSYNSTEGMMDTFISLSVYHVIPTKSSGESSQRLRSFGKRQMNRSQGSTPLGNRLLFLFHLDGHQD